MLFRVKLAFRLRDCLSHPYGEATAGGGGPSYGTSNSLSNEVIDSNNNKNNNNISGSSRASDNNTGIKINKTESSMTHGMNVVLQGEKSEKRSSRSEVKSRLNFILENYLNGTNNAVVVLEDAVKECYEIATENSELRSLFLELGLIDRLLEVARFPGGGNRTSVIFASLTLAGLTSHEDCRDYVLQKGILKLCLMQLGDSETPDELKGAWLRAIGRFSKRFEIAQFIVDQNGLQLITNTLHCGLEIVQKRALIALYFLGADKPSIQEAFISAGAIEPLLELSRQSTNSGLQLEAIDVCKVLSKNPVCADHLMMNSGVKIFIRAASEGPTKDVKDSAYRVLQRLCSHSTEKSEMIIRQAAEETGCDLSEDGVEKLINVFASGVISLQEEAAKIIEELCESDTIASNELARTPIVRNLVTLLTSASPEGVAYATHSLSHMLSNLSVKSEVIEQKKAIEAFLRILVHGSDRAADGAAICLEKLSSHRKVAEELVMESCVSRLIKSLEYRNDRVQLSISRTLFYLKAVKNYFLQNVVNCGGARIIVERCWRGAPQVKVLCASLLADLCLDRVHMNQVVGSGGICFRHGIQEMRLPCGKALSRMEGNPVISDKLLIERRVHAQITAAIAMLERDQNLKLSPSVEEAIKTIPRYFFAPSQKERAALSGKKITFEDSNLELPSLDVHVQILEALQLEQGMSFLELGAGTGYLLALAKHLVGEGDVCGIDGDRFATRFARNAILRLNEQRTNNELHPLIERRQIPEFISTGKRFDRIVVSISFPKTLLGTLRLLLRSNGKMTVPVDGQLLLIEKDSGLSGSRVLCPYRPLMIFKQMDRRLGDSSGVVIIDQEQNLVVPNSDPSLGSRIQHPESSNRKIRIDQKSRTPHRSRIDQGSRDPHRSQIDQISRSSHRSRIDQGSRTPHRRQMDRGSRTPHRSRIDRESRAPHRSKIDRKSRSPNRRDLASFEPLTEEQRREFAPYEISSQDVTLCVSPGGGRQCLGEGGFGAVYKALMNNVDEVAVKMVRAQNPTVQQRQSFLQEIRVLSSLRHRNIVQFYGARIRPDCTFFVTEMMKGGDLYTVMRKHRETMRWERFGKKVALDVALGLNYLHSRRPPMMHRDLKSPNVLLSEEGNAKIADVGMVRTQDRELVTAQCIMTPLWAAPEVMRKQKTSTKADVWSYGVLVWEIATGKDIVQYDPLAYKYVERRVSQSEPGKLMIMPEAAPLIARRIFTQCTKEDPNDRPEMKDIVRLLRKA
eukprot:g7409.t1